MKKRLFRKSKNILENAKAKAILIWFFEIAVALVLAAIVAIFFCQTIVMQESSMEPTLSVNDKMLLNKVSYKIGEPKRGDIIAYKKSLEDHASIFIKRVIGLPGETIQITEEGLILIDGEAYIEQRDLPTITNPGLAEDEITLGKDEYFVLGDNRNNSEDSRFADVGNVKESYIVGKLWFTISPFAKIGFIKK